MKKLTSVILAIVMLISFVLPASAADTLKLGTSKVTIGVGEAYTIKATGTTKTVSWTTSDKAVVTVKDGKIIGKKAGTATITAKVGTLTAKTTVTVKKAPTKVTAKDIKVNVGATVAPSVSLSSGSASKAKTYVSSDTKIAKVGKTNGKITGVKAGSCTVTVTTFNKKTATFKVTVNAADGALTLAEIFDRFEKTDSNSADDKLQALEAFITTVGKLAAAEDRTEFKMVAEYLAKLEGSSNDNVKLWAKQLTGVYQSAAKGENIIAEAETYILIFMEYGMIYDGKQSGSSTGVSEQVSVNNSEEGGVSEESGTTFNYSKATQAQKDLGLNITMAEIVGKDVHIQWKALAKNEADKIELLRASSQNGTYKVIATFSTASYGMYPNGYVDKGTASKGYYYAVRAVKGNTVGVPASNGIKKASAYSTSTVRWYEGKTGFIRLTLDSKGNPGDFNEYTLDGNLEWRCNWEVEANGKGWQYRMFQPEIDYDAEAFVTFDKSKFSYTGEGDIAGAGTRSFTIIK